MLEMNISRSFVTVKQKEKGAETPFSPSQLCTLREA